jgi:membrane protein
VICQIILIGSAWIAISADDADVDISGNKRDPHAPRIVAAADEIKGANINSSDQPRNKKLKRTIKSMIR